MGTCLLGGKYPWVASLAWSIVFILTFGVLILEIFPQTQEIRQNCVPEADKICFEIYDMRRYAITPLASLIYVLHWNSSFFDS